MKEIELKPCSCGCEAELVESQAFSWCDVTYYVRCTNPDCDERTELKYEHKIDAINAWNKKQEFLHPLIEKKSGDCKNCNSREKQIEEMAKDMCEYYYEGTCYQDKKPCDCNCDIFTDAQYLYTKGYRKQSEGEWREDFDGDCYCTSCGYYPKKDVKNFCPNCGAKMKGGAE